MKDYFYLNKEDKKLIYIYIKKPSKNQLEIEPQVSNSTNNKPSSSSLGNEISGGIIAILALTFLIIIALKALIF